MSASPQVAPPSAHPDDERSERPAGFLGVRWGLFARTLLPWLVLSGVLTVIVRSTAAPPTNPDTFFHLRFGSEFLSGQWSLRHPGSVSTFATAHWVPTQWLPEIVMAKTYRLFGLAGVAWLSGLQLMGLATSLYVLLRRWGEPLVVTGVMVVVLLSIWFALSMRPQVLSFILVLVTATAWLRTREDGRLRWWLIPLTWLWVMVHGMWPLGIAIGVIAVLGLRMDNVIRGSAVARALVLPGASALAACLTPVGPAAYGAVVAVEARSHFFVEWGTPDLRSVPMVALATLITVTLVLTLRSGVASSWTDVLFLGVALGCAAMSWRTVPVSAMITAPLAVRAIQRSAHVDPAPGTRAERRVILGLVAGALAVLAVAVPHTVPDPPHDPPGIDSTLSALPPGTKVVDAWVWGGYLVWRFPQLDFLMHGYGDTFTISELQRNTDIRDLQPGWDNELQQTGCRVAILIPDSALAYALQHEEGWSVEDKTPDVEILTAPPNWPNAS